MKFEDKEGKLPFKVEIRKKNLLTNGDSLGNKNLNNQQQKNKQQEIKNQEIQSNLQSLKKTLENNQNPSYISPLRQGYQKTLEEAEKKKQLEEERQKEQLISKRLYEEYKKRKALRLQVLENSNNNQTLGKRSMTAPKFNPSFKFENKNYQGTNYQANYQARSNNISNNNDLNGGSSGFNRTQFSPTKPPFASLNRPVFGQRNLENKNFNNQGQGQKFMRGGSPLQRNFNGNTGIYNNNRPLGINRPLNVFSSGMAKQYMGMNQAPNNTYGAPKKKTLEMGKEKKNTKISREKQENFDWRKYIENDENHLENQKIKKTKNAQKNKTRKQTSIVLQTSVSLTSLSKLTSVPIDDLINSAKSLGVKITNVQEILDNDLVSLVLDMHNFSCSFYGAAEELKEYLKTTPEENTEKRPPVVCVVGHVDHGKTSLLDSIKKTKVVEMEAGGITQNISMYQLKDRGNIIFIDTPGHSVFSTMRKVGLISTDIVILIIGADDGIKEQTREVIEMLKHYEKKIIICFTKIDRVNKDHNFAQIYNELSTKYEIIIEEYGGDVPVVKVSNKTGEGIKELLEVIEKTNEKMREINSYNKKRKATGTVINAYLEPGLGITSYLLLKQGTLKIGDEFISGKTEGKVRFLFTPEKAKECTPENIIKMVGFQEMPVAGDDFIVIPDEKLRKSVLSLRNKESTTESTTENNLDLLNRLAQKKISILLKADTSIALDSVKEALIACSNKQFYITIFSVGLGNINFNDIKKASEFDLIIVGFNVKVDKEKKTNSSDEVKIICNNIIYNILDEISNLTKKKEKITREEECGSGKIIEIFTFEKIVIGGCQVVSGSIFHSDNYVCEVFREKKSIFKGKIDSMKRSTNKIKEAKLGTEVGIIFENFTDLKKEDQIVCYKIIEEIVIIED